MADKYNEFLIQSILDIKKSMTKLNNCLVVAHIKTLCFYVDSGMNEFKFLKIDLLKIILASEKITLLKQQFHKSFLNKGKQLIAICLSLQLC